jgi:hypothetical protein
VRKGEEFEALVDVAEVWRPLGYWRGRTSDQMAALCFNDVGKGLRGRIEWEKAISTSDKRKNEDEEEREMPYAVQLLVNDCGCVDPAHGGIGMKRVWVVISEIEVGGLVGSQHSVLTNRLPCLNV